MCLSVCVWGAGRPTRPQRLAPGLVTLTAFLLGATGSRVPAGPRVGGAGGWRPEPVPRGCPPEAIVSSPDAGAAGPGGRAPLLHTEWTDFSFPAASGGDVLKTETDRKHTREHATNPYPQHPERLLSPLCEPPTHQPLTSLSWGRAWGRQNVHNTWYVSIL